MLPPELEALVDDAHGEDRDHGSDQPSDAVDSPEAKMPFLTRL